MNRMDELLAIMARLRDPHNGCPWDRSQTFRSIAPHTIEEAYEVEDAIARDDRAALVDELGDLLFQVVFHARLAEEEGSFAFNDVVSAIVDKMIRRHPHVFADRKIDSTAELITAWEQIKDAERTAAGQPERTSRLDDITSGLPSLVRALKLQQRASRAGFDWPGLVDVVPKLREEMDELVQAIQQQESPDRISEEIGDVLFMAVNLARHAHIDPNQSLHDANRKFATRFRRMESIAESDRPIDQHSLEELDAIWEQVKREE